MNQLSVHSCLDDVVFALLVVAGVVASAAMEAGALHGACEHEQARLAANRMVGGASAVAIAAVGAPTAAMPRV